MEYLDSNFKCSRIRNVLVSASRLTPAASRSLAFNSIGGNDDVHTVDLGFLRQPIADTDSGIQKPRIM